LLNLNADYDFQTILMYLNLINSLKYQLYQLKKFYALISQWLF